VKLQLYGVAEKSSIFSPPPCVLNLVAAIFVDRRRRRLLTTAAHPLPPIDNPHSSSPVFHHGGRSFTSPLRLPAGEQEPTRAGTRRTTRDPGSSLPRRRGSSSCAAARLSPIAIGTGSWAYRGGGLNTVSRIRRGAARRPSSTTSTPKAPAFCLQLVINHVPACTCRWLRGSIYWAPLLRPRLQLPMEGSDLVTYDVSILPRTHGGMDLAFLCCVYFTKN
jgi:hypothetical protein